MDQASIASRIARSDLAVIALNLLDQAGIRGATLVCRIRYTHSVARSRDWPAYPAPKEPRTTFNVGRIEGGTSVNAIPRKATMEVDLRSAAEAELQRLDAFFRRAMRDAADEENAKTTSGRSGVET